MEVLASFLIIVAFIATIHPLADVPENELIIHDNTPGFELSLKQQVEPVSQIKDKNIVKQQFDYSCGSAALATLLNYHLGEQLTEQQVIQGLMEYGDAAMIEQRRAFSLLDMKRFVGILGYKGAGYTADLNDLKDLDVPCIVPVEFFGYKHFVVYRGIYGDHIFFADPYMGNISFTLYQFKEMWYQNILFLVTDGGLSTDALQLSEEDLLLVDFKITRDALLESDLSPIVSEHRRFKETYGKYQFKNVNN